MPVRRPILRALQSILQGELMTAKSLAVGVPTRPSSLFSSFTDCGAKPCADCSFGPSGLKYHRQRAHEARHTSQTSPTTSVPLTPPSPRTSATRAPVNLADILACPLLSPRYAWLLAEVDLERLLPVILPQSRTLSDMLLLQLAGGAEWARKYAYRGQNA
eukprot:m.457096 g.457096  ORF g.457096 m.457096 type:complete len:160 (+) comp56981_c2_seq7:564-1043(+)